MNKRLQQLQKNLMQSKFAKNFESMTENSNLSINKESSTYSPQNNNFKTLSSRSQNDYETLKIIYAKILPFLWKNLIQLISEIVKSLEDRGISEKELNKLEQNCIFFLKKVNFNFYISKNNIKNFYLFFIFFNQQIFFL